MNNNNTRTFIKKELKYLYIYLNKKNRLQIKQKGTLFNTKAKTYIAKLINDFNTSIYIPASLPLINTVSEEVTPLNFSKRIIIYTIDTKGETYTLNFSKVQYLLNYGINIFRARKFLGKDDI